ncbi:MAG: archease [Thaumarchaeota archaeon]|nr:archease [Nitrososphaerota archaeon]
MPFRYLEHMTDAFIEVTAGSIEEAFATAGTAVVDTILDIKSVQKRGKRQVSVSSPDLYDLLYMWLEEVIILTITDGFAGREFEVSIHKDGQYRLEARISGEEIDFGRHHFRVEVKAPTFHLMEIIQDGGVVMRFLLDL